MRLGSFASSLISGAIFIAAFVTPSAARSAMATEMYKVLKINPYTLLLDKDTTLRDSGKLCVAQKCYEIGVWVWKTDRHRAQRILVFEIDHRNLTYIGGYRIDTVRPFTISGSKIVFSLPKDIGNEIDFSASGPPARTWVDGENPELFK